MLYLGVLCCNFEKLLLNLMSSPSNLFYCKIMGKNKNPEVWDQKCLIWVFSGFSLKEILL